MLPENTAAAKLLSLFLGERISPWDLDFSVGRRWVRQKELDRKNVLIQCWHNPEGETAYLTRFLSERLGQELGFWAGVCVRIAAAGQTVTPGGAMEILAVLGREEALRRLAVGIEKLGE